MPAHLRIALAGAWLAALTTLGLAQPPKSDAKAETPPVVRTGKPGETTLFMMVRTGPHLTPGNLMTTLEEGLSASGCKIDGKPIIRAVSPSVFEEIENLTQETAAAASAEPKPKAGLRRLGARDLAWEFRLASPSQVMKKLTIKYKKADGTEHAKEYTPASPGDDAPLVLIAPGVYALKVDQNDQPLSYDAEVVSLGQGGKLESAKLEGNWPGSDRYYIITMRNFRGEKDTLFTVLQDSQKVANPLDSIRLGSDLVFVFANLEAFGAEEDDDVIAGNNLILSAPPPRGRTVARGWVLFPLDEAGMKAQLDTYRKISDSRELITKVRENSLKAADAVELTPATAAKWLELPAQPNGRFRREIPMKDFKGLIEKYPAAYGLVVWEFENQQGMRSAIVMKLPGGGQSMVREKEIRNWSNALKEKVNAPK